MFDNCKPRKPQWFENTAQRWRTWKEEGPLKRCLQTRPEPPDPYAGLVTEREYYEQLQQYMQGAARAAHTWDPRLYAQQQRQQAGPPRHVSKHLAPDELAALTPQQCFVRPARLYQAGHPYRQAPDVRPLLAAVVYLPADKEAEPVPVYSAEQVAAAYASCSNSAPRHPVAGSVGTATAGNRHTEQQGLPPTAAMTAATGGTGSAAAEAPHTRTEPVGPADARPLPATAADERSQPTGERSGLAAGPSTTAAAAAAAVGAHAADLAALSKAPSGPASAPATAEEGALVGATKASFMEGQVASDPAADAEEEDAAARFSVPEPSGGEVEARAGVGGRANGAAELPHQTPGVGGGATNDGAIAV